MTKAELELLDRSRQQWSMLVDRTESSSPASPSGRRVRATPCPRGEAVWLPVLNVGPYPLNQDGASFVRGTDAGRDWIVEACQPPRPGLMPVAQIRVCTL